MHINLFVRRRENRLSQEDMAKLLNVHRQSYHLKEAGKREFTLSEAQKIAKHFNTTVDELFPN